MTFSVFSPIGGRKSGNVYPPVMPTDALPARFERTYIGAPELEVRIRRAIASYAVRTWAFWQSCIYVGALGLIIGAVVLHSHVGLVPLFGLIVVVMATSMPLGGLWEIREVAKTYSNPLVSYGASFSEAAIVWQTAAGTFQVKWDTIHRTYHRDRVTIVALENSRAIVVLPDELLTANAESRLKRIATTTNR